MAKSEVRMIANNKKAYHDYFILEKYEAGIVLHGTEVKSPRMGKCSIKEAFIRVESGCGIILRVQDRGRGACVCTDSQL